MTNERMLELLILLQTSYITHFNGNIIDRVDLYDRRYELMEEFLKPYVIDKAEKSE